MNLKQVMRKDSKCYLYCDYTKQKIKENETKHGVYAPLFEWKTNDPKIDLSGLNALFITPNELITILLLFQQGVDKDEIYELLKYSFKFDGITVNQIKTIKEAFLKNKVQYWLRLARDNDFMGLKNPIEKILNGGI